MDNASDYESEDCSFMWQGIRQASIVSAIACLQELVLHLICLLHTTTDALTDALTDVCTKCVFYVPDIMQATMYVYMGRYL